MKTKINLRFYILATISILTFFFASLICVLNANAKALAFAAEDDTVSSTKNDENAIVENEDEETALENELSITEETYGGVSTLAEPDTTVKGTLQWTDDSGNPHPLRRVKVEVYDYEVSCRIVLSEQRIPIMTEIFR